VAKGILQSNLVWIELAEKEDFALSKLVYFKTQLLELVESSMDMPNCEDIMLLMLMLMCSSQ